MKNLLTILVFLFLGQFTFAQKLEPISSHYKTLAERKAMSNNTASDTLSFPWIEYSKGGLSYSLWGGYYLTKQNVYSIKQSMSFPANSSEQTRAELDYLLDLQAKRTPKEIERATYLANIGYWPSVLNPTDPDYKQNLKDLFYIASPIGEWFNAQNFPKTAHLLKNALLDARVLEFNLKLHYRRARPYHLESKMQNLQKMGSPSFPSGHTLWAFTQAFLYSEIIPEMRTKFIELADEIRWSREVLGIHYPSDNEASRQISWQVIQSYKKNPEFLKDLAAAKAEWKEKSPKFK